MLYLLFSLVAILIILFITANIQVTSYSKKFENFTISTIGNIRDKYKLKKLNKELSAIKYKMKNKKEIEDVQIVDNSEVLQYLD
jgi:hypothetical protein